MNDVALLNQSEHRGFAVTAITKLAHAKLLALAETYGGIPSLAREIGIHEATLRSWIYLRCLPLCGQANSLGRRKQHKRTTAAVLKLCELTGKPPESLFPGFVRECLTGKSLVKKETRTISMSAIGHAPRFAISYTTDFDAIDRAVDLTSAWPEVTRALNRLSYREREIIKARYGLCEGPAMTLEETGRVFCITKERVRQLEAKALSKLARFLKPNNNDGVTPAVEET